MINFTYLKEKKNQVGMISDTKIAQQSGKNSEA